ncbi:MAG: hypothetical protein P8Y93_01130 [Acidobacteriota bacterium]
MARWNTWRKISAVAALVVALSCASSKKQPDLVVDNDEGNLTLAISAATARAVVEELVGGDLDCKADTDGEMTALLHTLDQGGAHARASYRNGETTVEGRRRGGRLDLEIRGSGSGRIEATMPWAVAECLLGRKTAVDKAIRSSIKVKVSNDDGGSFSVRLD